MTRNPETSMPTSAWRWMVMVAALGIPLGGCGDNVEVTGMGLSTGLSSSYMTGSDEIGTGNVHWVGNPRW